MPKEIYRLSNFRFNNSVFPSGRHNNKVIMTTKNKKTSRFFALGLAFFSFSIFSCNDKKQWKETTTVEYHFYVTQSITTPNIQFTSGTMMVSNVSCSGSRKQGDPVNFSDYMDYTIVANLIDGTTNSIIKYDMPQGIYTNITADIKAVSSGTPSLKLLGTFYFEKKSYPFVFEFNADQIFNLKGKNQNGGSEITLVSGTPATCEIKLNLNYWFAAIDEETLEHATKTTIDGVSTILVNEKINPTIYALIVPRMNQANTAIFR